jgi:predicted nucleic acid-binding protein
MAIQINIHDVPNKVCDELAASAARQGKSIQDFLRADLSPVEPLDKRFWDQRRSVTSCDARHVAIAEAPNLPLATLDRSLSRSKKAACEFLAPKL